MTTNEIVDSIYKAYGTDSGILFGIKERDITKAIVEFTVNRISDERQALLNENIELKEKHSKVVDRLIEMDKENKKLLDSRSKLAKALQDMKNEGHKLLNLYAHSDHYTEADMYKLFRTGVGNWIEKAEQVLKEAGLE